MARIIGTAQGACLTVGELRVILAGCRDDAEVVLTMREPGQVDGAGGGARLVKASDGSIEIWADAEFDVEVNETVAPMALT